MMQTKTNKLERALLDAQKSVESLIANIPATAPNGEPWSYAASEDVQRVARDAFHKHDLLLTVLESVIAVANLRSVFRLRHVESGQYQDFILDWPRFHNEQVYSDVPLACVATGNHQLRWLRLNLLDIPVHKIKPTLRAQPPQSDVPVIEQAKSDEIDVKSLAEEVPAILERWRVHRGLKKHIHSHNAWNMLFPRDQVERISGIQNYARLAEAMKADMDGRWPQ